MSPSSPISRHGSRALTGCLLAVFVCVTPSSASPAPLVRPLAVSVALADTLFLEEEPIYAIVQLTNEGRDPETSPSLNPQAGWIELFLTQLPNGRPSFMGGLKVDSFRPRPVFTLGPGETECETANLLDLFGGSSPTRWPFSLQLGEFTLAPGRYRLTGRLLVPSGGGSPSAPLTIPPVDFSVRVRTEFPAEDSLMTALARECRPGATLVDSFWTCCGRMLPRFFGSRMFVYVWCGSGFRSPDLTTEEILGALRENGTPDTYRATILGVACKIQRFEGHLDAAWLARMETVAHDPQCRRVLESWKNRLRRNQVATKK